MAATIIPSVEVEKTRAAHHLLRAQVATNEALGSVRETCRELQEHIDEAHAHAHAAPGGHRHPAPDPAMPRLPPASPLWA
jgi:hypothetical protein